LAASMILPLFALQNIRPMDFHLFGRYLSEVFITASSGSTEKSNPGFTDFLQFSFVYLIYISVSVFFILKLIIDLINLLYLIYRQSKHDTRIIRFHGFSTAGFSAMGYVFINDRLGAEEAAEIILHEQNHLKRNHFADIILVEIIKALQWFNPSIYMFNRSLRAIHEFQADQECLTSGITVVNYQSLLLNQVFKTNSFNLTNSFSNPSLIRKRMIMMTKKRTAAIANAILRFVIPVIGIVFLFISAFGKVNSTPALNPASEASALKTETGEEEPFVQVEQMPMFPGGDAALLNYLAEHSVYPENAKKNGIQGKVVIRFCVTASGAVTRVGVLKGVDPELDAEAVRVAKTLPAFTPGKQDGRDVPVWFMVPITFALK
jgi:TonB family protein